MTLHIIEDDLSCAGATSTMTIFVPCCATIPSLVATGTPSGSVTAITPTTGSTDFVLVDVFVLISGGVLVSVVTPRSTPNTTWNAPTSPCFIPFPRISYTSSLSGLSHIGIWTSTPRPPAMTRFGNIYHEDKINFW